MKKVFAMILALAMTLGMTAAVAESTDAAVEVKAFDSVWATEDAEYFAEVFTEDDSVKIAVTHVKEGMMDGWEYSAQYNEQDKTLVTAPTGIHYTTDLAKDNDLGTVHYEDGEAVFALTEAGKLTWKDQKEDAGKGLEFANIGNFWHTNWKKDDLKVEFYDWYEGEYDVRAYKLDDKNEIKDNAILKGTYDPQTNTVTAYGAFDDGNEIEVVFSYDKDYNLVWAENGNTIVLSAALD